MAGFFRRTKNRFLTTLYRSAVFLVFRVKIYYEDPKQKDAPPQGIYISNHMGHLDGILIRGVFYKKIRLYSLVTSDWMDKKWAKNLLFYEDCIPVNRENPGTGWIHAARKAVKEGASINIFPEGHTSKSEEMDTFKPGFLLLASMIRDLPVIPVASAGKYSPFFGQRKKVMVGRPVYPDRSRLKDQQSLDEYAEEFRTQIGEMKKQLLGG